MILDLAPIAFSCKEYHVTPNILQPLERIVPEGFNPVIVCPRQGVIITNILQPQATGHGTIQLLYTY